MSIQPVVYLQGSLEHQLQLLSNDQLLLYPTIVQLVSDITDDDEPFVVHLPQPLSDSSFGLLFSTPPLFDTATTLELASLYVNLTFLGWSDEQCLAALFLPPVIHLLSQNIDCRYHWSTAINAIPNPLELSKIASSLLHEHLFLPFPSASPHVLSDLFPPPSPHWIVAGGSILNHLANLDCPSSDIDIFVFESGYYAILDLIHHYSHLASERQWDATIYPDGCCWTISFDHCPTLIQIIASPHSNPYDIVLDFDMDAVQCYATSPSTFFASTACFDAIHSRVIKQLSPQIRSVRSWKMQNKGFTLQGYYVDVMSHSRSVYIPKPPPKPNKYSHSLPLCQYQLPFVIEHSTNDSDYFHFINHLTIRACDLHDTDWLENLRLTDPKIDDAADTTYNLYHPSVHALEGTPHPICLKPRRELVYQSQSIVFHLPPMVLSKANSPNFNNPDFPINRSGALGHYLFDPFDPPFNSNYVNGRRVRDFDRLSLVSFALQSSGLSSTSRFKNLKLPNSIKPDLYTRNVLLWVIDPVRLTLLRSTRVFDWNGSSLDPATIDNRFGQTVLCAVGIHSLVFDNREHFYLDLKYLAFLK